MTEILSISRVENKYLISEKERYLLQSYFSKVLHQDPHNGIDGYLVRSLYFDTLFDDDYQQKMDGLEERHKLRLRIYGPSDRKVKLELKQKCGIYQQKQSLILEREAAERLIGGDLSPLEAMDTPLAMQLRNMMLLEVYRPKCIVEYRRFAYIYPSNNIRITFDSQIRASLSAYGFFSEEPCASLVQMPGRCIMEVKYDNFMLSYIKDMLSKCSAAQTSASKYCLARDLTL